MSDPEKHLTEAEKQIRRLEALRLESESISKQSVEKAYFPAKTQVEKTTEKLTALRQASKSSGSKRAKIDGKQKSSKLRFLQIRILEQLYQEDKRLRGSVVTRVALNRFLGLDNTPEENEFEARINEILRQYKNRG